MNFAISVSSKGIGVPCIEVDRCSEMELDCVVSATLMTIREVVVGVMPKRRNDSAIWSGGD